MVADTGLSLLEIPQPIGCPNPFFKTSFYKKIPYDLPITTLMNRAISFTDCLIPSIGVNEVL
jgi:hypothetical protein